jgi:uncharacterized protein (TIGR00255 family)
MARSMTGCGRNIALDKDVKATVDVRAVNHRYLEVVVKSAQKTSVFDERIKKMVRERFSRGYVEVSISCQTESGAAKEFMVNEPLLASYMTFAQKLSERYGVGYPPKFADVLAMKDILIFDASDEVEEVWPALESALTAALDQLAESRKVEGEQIIASILNRIDLICGHVDIVATSNETTIPDRLERLRARIEKLLDTVTTPDSDRLYQEAAILADKADVAEEIERLRSHIEQVRVLLAGNGEAGRRLEFFLQEMNREVNTIGSKTASADMTVTVVEMKSELEKIREQAQNLE